jgi:ATP-dependent helicase HrpA
MNTSEIDNQRKQTVSRRISDIQYRLSEAMVADRVGIFRRLSELKRRGGRQAVGKGFLSELTRLEKRLATSIQDRKDRLTGKPSPSYAEQLPIFTAKDTIVQAIREVQVVIISGETGSGKSTQIPKMCLEAGQGVAGKIGCTQPRRIAATSIAHRIAEELGEQIGRSVGYKIRFTDRSSPNAYIKVMTDGMLLAETQRDPFLSEYDTIIVDEAHERSLNIDLLLGLLKTLLPRRKELKVIVTSATMDTAKFTAAFEGAPVIEVKGRLYPVEVEYLPVEPKLEEAGEFTYVDMAVQAVERLRRDRIPGDTLIFMPTEQDIRETCALLEARKLPQTTVLPLFARLTKQQQQRVFGSFTGTKIVVATNVAETSLTIPDIRYVVDTGLARIPRYLPRSRTTSMAIGLISKSSAEQRKGRCGRVQAGVCIRLYSEDGYESRPEFTSPEILRSNLAEVILKMLSLRVSNVASFPFLDAPRPKSVKDGLDLLLELGAIEKQAKTFALTARGKIMARMPLDPQISRMILEAVREGCVEEVAVIASALSLQDPRERPLDKAAQADQMHAPFKDPDSDFITLLNIWNRYHRSLDAFKTQSKMRKYCRENFLSFNRMRDWRDIHEQITSIVKGHPAEPPYNEGNRRSRAPESRYAKIHRSILSGYLFNIATKKDKNIYQAAKGREVMLFPGSTLFNRGCAWIVAAEMVKTSRLFARTVAKIEPAWLESLGGSLCRSSYAEPHWVKSRGEVRAYEQVTLHGLVIVLRRLISYGPIDPEESHRIFVEQALVEGRVKDSFSFLHHNQKLIERIVGLEAKLRRKDLLVSRETMASFYLKRLPGVVDIQTLKKRIDEQGGDAFLKITEEELLLSRPDETALADYPGHLTIAGRDFGLSYTYAPGGEEDGITIHVPATLASRFPTDRLDWVVPGLLDEKITALIKGLPKRYRRQLVPVSRTAATLARDLVPTSEPLVTALARLIYQQLAVDIPASEWRTSKIPDHLKMRVAITDHHGRILRAGRDMTILRRPLNTVSAEQEGLQAWQDARTKWEMTGMTAWTFEALPEQIHVGVHLVAHPGLEPADGSINIRLFSSADRALETHQRGVAKLFGLHLAKDLKFVRRALKLPTNMANQASYFGGLQVLEKALYDNLIKRLFYLDIRTPEAFYARAAEIEPNLISNGKDLMERVELILRSLHLARSLIRRTEETNRSNKAVVALCIALRQDLESLVPPHFLELYSLDRLGHLPRYLKSMGVRVERGANDIEKDHRKAADVAVFEAAHGEMTKTLSPHSSADKLKALDEYRWMIEEYKVSVFAQDLKTPFPISSKRLRKRAGEIERMI